MITLLCPECGKDLSDLKCWNCGWGVDSDKYIWYGTTIKEVTTMKEEGRKDDQDKIRMELLPPELMWGVADILTFGAKKYSDRNWEAGMDWSRVYGALQRHLNAWWGGEQVDRETGKSHLWHAGCCIAFLIAYEQRKVGNDDRPQSNQ